MTNPDQTSLVTGGAGFIGSELVRQLLEDGEKVIVYDNFSFGRRSNLPEHKNLEVVEGDIVDIEGLQRAFDKYSPSKVFHLAALHFIPYCIKHPQETIRVNVEGTLNVLEACKKGPVKGLVYASSAAVYPVRDIPHHESDLPGPLEIYGMSKLFGEHLVKSFHSDTGVQSYVARFFNGYGPRETNPHVIPEILEQVSHSDQIRLGNVEPKRDYIHTSDISRAVRMMAGKGTSGLEVFNVGTGEGISVREIVDLIADILKRPLEIVSDDSRKRKVERYQLVSDISKIRNELGWKPQISFRDGLLDLLRSVGLL